MSQTHERAERILPANTPPRTPRWAKLFCIIFIIIVALVLVAVLLGGSGNHGPGRHMPSNGAGGPTPPSIHGLHQL